MIVRIALGGHGHALVRAFQHQDEQCCAEALHRGSRIVRP
jgi:hypothetical protein